MTGCPCEAVVVKVTIAPLDRRQTAAALRRMPAANRPEHTDNHERSYDRTRIHGIRRRYRRCRPGRSRRRLPPHRNWRKHTAANSSSSSWRRAPRWVRTSSRGTCSSRRALDELYPELAQRWESPVSDRGERRPDIHYLTSDDGRHQGAGSVRAVGRCTTRATTSSAWAGCASGSGEQAENAERINIFPGLCRRGGAVRRTAGARHRRRDQRHGCRQGWREEVQLLPARLRVARQVHDFGRRRAGQSQRRTLMQIASTCAQNADPQHYGIGFKEVWEVEPEQARRGARGPLRWAGLSTTIPRAAVFSITPPTTRCILGFIIALSYRNPHLAPFERVPALENCIRGFVSYLEGGKRVGYGARAVNKGGLQSLPEAECSRAACWSGCGAGFLNGIKIKGAHIRR